MDTANVTIPFKLKIIEKAHSFASRPLIFKLQQKVLKFNDNLRELKLPKKTNF